MSPNDGDDGLKLRAGVSKMNTGMNTGKKIIHSLLIIILVTTVLVPTLLLTPPAGGTPDNTPPGKEPGGATGEVKMAPDAGPAFDPRCDKDVKGVANGTPASLVELAELVEFYSRKYFKLALDYLFEFLNSPEIFPPEDLASSSNHADRRSKKRLH